MRSLTDLGAAIKHRFQARRPADAPAPEWPLTSWERPLDTTQLKDYLHRYRLEDDLHAVRLERPRIEYNQRYGDAPCLEYIEPSGSHWIQAHYAPDVIVKWRYNTHEYRPPQGEVYTTADVGQIRDMLKHYPKATWLLQRPDGKVDYAGVRYVPAIDRSHDPCLVLERNEQHFIFEPNAAGDWKAWQHQTPSLYDNAPSVAPSRHAVDLVRAYGRTIMTPTPGEKRWMDRIETAVSRYGIRD